MSEPTPRRLASLPTATRAKNSLFLRVLWRRFSRWQGTEKQNYAGQQGDTEENRPHVPGRALGSGGPCLRRVRAGADRCEDETRSARSQTRGCWASDNFRRDRHHLFVGMIRTRFCEFCECGGRGYEACKQARHPGKCYRHAAVCSIGGGKSNNNASCRSTRKAHPHSSAARRHLKHANEHRGPRTARQPALHLHIRSRS